MSDDQEQPPEGTPPADAGSPAEPAQGSGAESNTIRWRSGGALPTEADPVAGAGAAAQTGGPEDEPDGMSRAEQEFDAVIDSAQRTGRRAVHEIIHDWIPLGIAIISVLAALMGWRAAITDQTATHDEELSRQDLVQQQELLIQDNDAVDQDIRTYGQFAQFSALAESELQGAGKIGGAVGTQLRIQGQADLGIARYLGRQISFLNYAYDPSNPNGNSFLHPDGTLAAGNAYNQSLGLAVAENQDAGLHGLAPARLESASDTARNHGVDLVGIAALFIAVIVLLTFGAIVRGPPKVWLACSGAVLTIVGLVLFAVVELT